MIKTKTITVPAKKAHTKEVDMYICDVCSKEHQDGHYFTYCSVCQRLICRDCYKTDPYEYGDYPAKFCTICYDLRFTQYGYLYDAEEKIHDTRIEELDKRILEKSLAVKDDLKDSQNDRHKGSTQKR